MSFKEKLVAEHGPEKTEQLLKDANYIIASIWQRNWDWVHPWRRDTTKADKLKEVICELIMQEWLGQENIAQATYKELLSRWAAAYRPRRVTSESEILADYYLGDLSLDDLDFGTETVSPSAEDEYFKSTQVEDSELDDLLDLLEDQLYPRQLEAISSLATTNSPTETAEFMGYKGKRAVDGLKKSLKRARKRLAPLLARLTLN